MRAYRAKLGSLLAYHDVTAVGALPYHVIILGEYDAVFDIADELAVASFMFSLDLADHFEESRDSREAFRLCFFFKLLIHIGPFVVFAVCR